MKMRYLSAIILLAGLVIVIIYRQTEHTRGTDLDKLNDLLIPVKQKLGPSSFISFDCNLKDMNFNELYFKTAFVLAPVLVTQESDRDTLLAISSLSNPAPVKTYKGYRILDSGTLDNYKFALMALTK